MSIRHTRIAAAVIAAIGACGATSAGAQQPAAPAAPPPQQLDRVEITGSSIKRISGETALPVQVLTAEDIARTGVTSTEQLLRSISAIDAAGIANDLCRRQWLAIDNEDVVNEIRNCLRASRDDSAA